MPKTAQFISSRCVWDQLCIFEGGANRLTGLDIRGIRDHQKRGHPWGASLSLDKISRTRPAEEDPYEVDGIKILPTLEKQVCAAYACACTCAHTYMTETSIFAGKT